MTKAVYDKLRDFDNGLDKYSDRKEFIDNIYGESDEVLSIAGKNSSVAKAIEDHATYLLSSKDIDSGRKVDYCYYSDESDYRSHYAIGKNTLSVDMNERVDLHASDEIFEIDNPDELLSLSKMSSTQKRILIREFLSESKNPYNSYKSYLEDIIEDIKEQVKSNPIDRDIIDLVSEGLTELEIAKIMNVSRRNINRRINKIADNIV